VAVVGWCEATARKKTLVTQTKKVLELTIDWDFVHLSVIFFKLQKYNTCKILCSLFLSLTFLFMFDHSSYLKY
jgi:hypothetical protein